MKRHRQKELEGLLAECMERMAKGASVEDCLATHPERAGELRPLLLTVASLHRSYNVSASLAARARGRQRLQEQIASVKERRRRRSHFGLRGSLRVWAAASALALVLFGGSAGVVAASGNSLPDQPFYPVKRTVERVRLAWPLQSRGSKADYSADLAALRAHEVVAMAGRNKVEQLTELTERIQVNLDRATRIEVNEAELPQGAPPPPSSAPLRKRQRLQFVRERLEQDYESGLVELNAVASRAPSETRPQIVQCIQRYERHYQDAVQRIDDRLQRGFQPAGDREGKPGFPPREPRPSPLRPRTPVPQDGTPGSETSPVQY